MTLTKEQKDKIMASLGVLIMTVLIAFWTPLTVTLLRTSLDITYIAFIMIAYSAVITFMSKFVVTALGTPAEEIPSIPKPE